MTDSVVSVGSRAVGFIDYGPSDGVPVLWCHGGPGSRLEPAYWATTARQAGLRLVGIDRPGYGLSSARPERSIVDWVEDASAVADRLGINRFAAVGVSTGGAYALALAARLPARVTAVVACCSMTDMRHGPSRSTMSQEHCHAVWDAPDRESAIAAAVAAHGEGGSKLLDGSMNAVLPPSDLALFRDPAWMAATMDAWPAMFTNGLAGYADDRIADRDGWITFDVADIRCPVAVLHGARDVIVDPIHAAHTAAIVPNAELLLHDELGHFSIEREIVPTLIPLVEPP